MANYRIGIGGDDGADGLTWNSRLATIGEYLSRAAAGDYGFVGAGAYREFANFAVSGTPGNRVYLIGDRMGYMTDGIGGIVRITGSDDDESATRNYCLSVNGYDYITIQGFHLDTSSSHNVILTDVSDVDVLDCVFQAGSINGNNLRVNNDCANINILRNAFLLGPQNASNIYLVDGATQRDNTGIVIRNNRFENSQNGIYISRICDIDIEHNTFLGMTYGIRDFVAHTGGQVNNVWSNIFTGCTTAMREAAANDLVRDYNKYWNCGAYVYGGGAAGAHDAEKPPIFEGPRLWQGYRVTETPCLPSEWSPCAYSSDYQDVEEDLYGTIRPNKVSARSTGAVQRGPATKDTNRRYAGAYSNLMAKPGVFQMRFPVNTTPVTVTAQIYVDAAYAGTILPWMKVKEPGQADRTVLATGPKGAWQEVSITFTPSGAVNSAVVEFGHDSNTVFDYGMSVDNVEVAYA